MMYVLIVMSYISNGGGVTTMHDFNTKEACETAKEFVIKNQPGRGWVAECLPKGM